jgi:hypothetical protein
MQRPIPLMLYVNLQLMLHAAKAVPGEMQTR